MRIALLTLVLLACGCKHTSPTDLSSPENTLKSFFKAIEESRIPNELNAFVLDVKERRAFKTRCEMRGCKKGSFEIVKVEKMGESSAILVLNYKVVGNKGRIVMQGKNSPVSFERIGSNWGVTQFGRRVSPTPRKKSESPPPAVKGDSPTKQDGGPNSDAAQQAL